MIAWANSFIIKLIIISRLTKLRVHITRRGVYLHIYVNYAGLPGNASSINYDNVNNYIRVQHDQCTVHLLNFHWRKNAVDTSAGHLFSLYKFRIFIKNLSRITHKSFSEMFCLKLTQFWVFWVSLYTECIFLFHHSFWLGCKDLCVRSVLYRFWTDCGMNATNRMSRFRRQTPY